MIDYLPRMVAAGIRLQQMESDNKRRRPAGAIGKGGPARQEITPFFMMMLPYLAVSPETTTA